MVSYNYFTSALHTRHKVIACPRTVLGSLYIVTAYVPDKTSPYNLFSVQPNGTFSLLSNYMNNYSYNGYTATPFNGDSLIGYPECGVRIT